MAAHGEYDRTEVETYVIVKQRRGVCYKCSSVYTGEKVRVNCIICEGDIQTQEIKCDIKIVTGAWTIPCKAKIKKKHV